MLCFQRDFQDKTSSLSRLILLSDYQTAFKLPSESSVGFDRFSLNECQHSTSPATWTSHQTKHTRTELTEQRHSRQGSLLEGNFCPSANTLDSYSHCSHLQDWKFLEIFLLYWKNLQRPHVILYLDHLCVQRRSWTDAGVKLKWMRLWGMVTVGNSLQRDAQGFDKTRRDRGGVNKPHYHSGGEHTC